MYDLIETGDYGRELRRTTHATLEEALTALDAWEQSWAGATAISDGFGHDIPYLVIRDNLGCCYLETGSPVMRKARVERSAADWVIEPSREYPAGVSAPRILVDTINDIFRQHGRTPIATIR